MEGVSIELGERSPSAGINVQIRPAVNFAVSLSQSQCDRTYAQHVWLSVDGDSWTREPASQLAAQSPVLWAAFEP